DLTDTAAVIKQLDLVITIDTVIAHLAGALGKPVWVMLNFDSDWRWMLDRNDSPWYPTARLFRQPKIGDWDSVFIEVKQALIEFMEFQQNLPDLPTSFELAYQYYQENNLVEAEKICRRILAEKLEDFQALNLLAVLENLAGRNDMAIQILNQVIILHPNSSQAYSNLGNILKKECRLEEAISNYQKAISLEPNDSSNYSNLGFILFQKDQIESAIANYEKSLFLEPNNSQINFNLGHAWQTKGDLSKAIAYYQKAINLRPNYALAYRCLGLIFRGQRNLTVSISHYIKAIEIEPNYADAHFGLAVTLLLNGNLKEGFQEYHWRWQRWEIKKSLSLIQPEKLWDGSNLTGKTIVLYAEQGYGDTIQFIRYLPLVKQHGGQIILGCQKPLVRLLEKIPGVEKILEEGVNSLSFDVHAPLLELPRIFGTTLDNIPPPIRNLNIPEVLPIKLEPPEINSLKVGMVWMTKPSNPTTTKRSCKLRDFQSILDIAGVTFYS
ncbi:MAG: tetratricopeptide repeat protein, partial [Okeania sp. SIO3I5]|uniref:tetratricopeptide repeat protein n=1 Tax=Okeania sp. SIO3I5 TaxID=2607805 RepID=UPI0013BD85F9